MPDNRTSVTVVIPARFGSSRFPGKPLAMLAGKPLVQHVYEHAAKAPEVDQVVVATDDARIHDAVKVFGGNAMMVEGAFRTGTDRVAAVARHLPGHVFLNLQGDEIVLHPSLLTDLIVPFLKGGAEMGTLKRRVNLSEEIHNPDVVKVVTNQAGDALYFSRAPIPHRRDRGVADVPDELHDIHLGLYIYTRQTLLQFSALPTGRLEDAEKLEQLRALEYGIPIRVWETEHPSLRIDTPRDLERATIVLEQHGRGHIAVRG
ncbi:MAG TPA: 3-deoxy-manno-octulosonate cytidylyltransferase [Nitrospiraceae bacterium]|nr:3-deoxy-manno-octulosonate cytidylyltransferase [Nitrospiraceae bacterium]